MSIILVRVRERPEGSLYIDRKVTTISDEYIAISHVWGSPDTVQKTAVNGVSWEVSLSPAKQDILSLLRRDDICGNGWFWMDLFCIDQTESSPISIADQLMSIPGIYKSSKCVKVLIESPVCKDWQETAMAAFDRGPLDQDVFQEEELAHGRKCANFLFMDPWFKRLWTRQEGLYARVIHFVILRPVECERLAGSCHSNSKTDWATHGTLLARRFGAETFLLDKMAYHGLEPSAAAGSLFSLYFDVMYRQRVDVTLALNCEPGPHLRYNPVVDAWRSGRFTAKPRDYILAVFPDIDGYMVPAGAREMSFPQLAVNAIGQLAVSAKLHIVSKVPRGLGGPSANAQESMLPWLVSAPEHIGEAYDSFTADFPDVSSESPKPSTISIKALPGDIRLLDINATPSGLAELIKGDWDLTVDIERHMRLLALDGPCTGVSRQAINCNKGYNTSSFLQQHFAESFMSVAVSQWASEQQMSRLTLRTGSVLPNLEKVVSEVAEEIFAFELKRFLICLICGTSLLFADKVLEVADVVRVMMPYGSLLGVVHRKTRLTAKAEELKLLCGPRWDLQGLYIGRRIEGGVSIRGRTAIPNSKIWESAANYMSSKDS